LVEQRPFKAWVAGSIPAALTISNGVQKFVTVKIGSLVHGKKFSGWKRLRHWTFSSCFLKFRLKLLHACGNTWLAHLM
jgi:hypothetical protein